VTRAPCCLIQPFSPFPPLTRSGPVERLPSIFWVCAPWRRSCMWLHWIGSGICRWHRWRFCTSPGRNSIWFCTKTARVVRPCLRSRIQSICSDGSYPYLCRGTGLVRVRVSCQATAQSQRSADTWTYQTYCRINYEYKGNRSRVFMTFATLYVYAVIQYNLYFCPSRLFCSARRCPQVM
jgi:hypothetical protein